jgi:hypothetical protein
MRGWREQVVWNEVAAELRGHRLCGLAGLLTEDVVRFATARALVAAGVDAAELRVEAPHPVLKGSRVDLVVGKVQPAALIELKFPREPNLLNAAWTMALGELLKDFYRLAAYPGEVDRMFVYVEIRHLRTNMAGVARRYGVDLDTENVTLSPADAAKLPSTAAQIIGAELAALHVTTRRVALIPIDDELRLAVYEVDPLTTPTNLLTGGVSLAIATPALTVTRCCRHSGTPAGWSRSRPNSHRSRR